MQFVVQLNSLFSPRKEIRRLVDEFRGRLTFGRTTLGMTLQGKLQLVLGKKARNLRLVTDLVKSDWVFRLSEDDLRSLSFYFHEPMGDEEISFIASYPFRAADILLIRDEVAKNCEEQKKKSFSYPVSALRHVLWSYLLNDKFDANFSSRLLDKHQQDKQSTKSELAMNHNNQRVGREWLDAEVAREELADKVLSSNEVIRILVEDKS